MTFSAFRRAGVVLVAALLAPGAALAATAQIHVHWLHRDDPYLGRVHVTRVNTDEVPDVIVVGGDRLGYTISTPCSPASAVHMAGDTAIAPVPGIAALDGRNGNPLWEVTWDTGGPVGQRPERTHVHMLENVVGGDLDRDGTDDLLVLRSAFANDRSEIVQVTTMYEARTGAVQWETRNTLPGDVLAFRIFQYLDDLFGQPGGLLAHATVDSSLKFSTSVQLVSMNPKAPPSPVLDLPSEEGSGSFPIAVPYGDGLRLVSFIPHITFPPPQITVDLRADDIALGEDGELVVSEAWTLPAGGGGLPVVVTEGSDPAIVLGQEAVTALDLADGSLRWKKPVDVGPEGGTFISADVNSDGVEDVVASPRFGPERTGGLFSGGLFAEIVALDGRTGADVWRIEEPAAKFRAWGLDVANIDGGGKELVASMMHQDGFATCAIPDDDPGMLAVFDLHTGEQKCRLATDRFAIDVGSANLDGAPGDELVAATTGGNTYSLRDADPACGALGTNPLS